MRALMVLGVSSVLLLGLPLLGVVLAGQALTLYLAFPPVSRQVKHAPFSWLAFGAFALIIGATLLPFVLRVCKERRDPVAPRPPGPFPFPWWGWTGLGLGGIAWVLAWTRFAWFALFQAYTFTPLWAAYILVLNALTYRRTGHCLLSDRPRFALLLMPVSALFWWYFEYLNRFVQNWSYLGIETFTSWQYAFFATLSFATVLPAMLSTYAWLHTFPRLTGGLDHFLPLRLRHTRLLSWLLLLISSIGLVGVGLWPDYCFPLLWVAPLFLITACQRLLGMQTIFAPAQHGDWRQLWLWALAGLMCGGFWEMWNAYSQAKWVYSIPFVNRFHLFEMPLLGYGGYIPFGLECAAIVAVLRSCPKGRSSGVVQATPALGKAHHS